MRIALVHDHLISDGGAERVLKAFTELWPDAPIYTLLHDPAKTGFAFADKTIHLSSLQKWPLSVSKYQWTLPLRPHAIEQFDLSDYDIILSNSASQAKGVRVGPNTLHINYCHTPTRYLWINPEEAVDALERVWPISQLSYRYKNTLRRWDLHAVDRVHTFISNSQNTKRRIKQFYNREAPLIYPPVYIDICTIDAPKDYFLTGGRLVSYKRFDIAVQAFNRTNIPLKIYGVGPELERLKKMAMPNIEFLGHITEEEKVRLHAGARAFVYPQEEDFGITPVELMSCGRPVIAYKAGGALETVIDGVTGIFFEDQDWASLADAVIRFSDTQFDPHVIAQHAYKFSAERFKKEIREFVEGEWKRFQDQNSKL